MSRSKKLFAFVIVSCLLTFQSAVFAAEPSILEQQNEIHISDYMTFYDHQDYYKDLAKQGYTIVIDVPDEYSALENARITSDTETDKLTPPMARGQFVPSNKWNILDKGPYNFSGESSNYGLYTNYAIVGGTSYAIQVHNTSGIYDLGVEVTGARSSGDFLVGTGRTVIKYIVPESSSTRFYLYFSAPCYFEGSISRDT